MTAPGAIRLRREFIEVRNLIATLLAYWKGTDLKKYREIVALTVFGAAAFCLATGALATNRGKHIVGGYGSHHRGGHFVGRPTNRGMHIVGGRGSHHRGGHMVR